MPVDVPEDFDMVRLLRRRFFPEEESLNDFPLARIEVHGGVHYLLTGERVEAGTPVLSFDLIAGDILLVDRLTSHFFPLRRGEALVFATRSVPAMRGADRYFIKRLVGLGGDRLSVVDGQLLANGTVADFNGTVAAINRRDFPHDGYFPLGIFESSDFTVPVGHAFVLGDNSAHSYDSRFFGPIPVSSIVGRPLLKVYPWRR
jgi:signal peptidase I